MSTAPRKAAVSSRTQWLLVCVDCRELAGSTRALHELPTSPLNAVRMSMARDKGSANALTRSSLCRWKDLLSLVGKPTATAQRFAKSSGVVDSRDPATWHECGEG